MRIGIYNRWLATLGGGEKYSLAVAEHLARAHTVSVITHRAVSKAQAEERLNLDLAAVDFVTVPDRPTNELASITGDYDFFVNASFLDMFSSLARHSALIVYFPIPLSMVRAKRLYRVGGLFLKRLLMVPSFSGVLDTRSIEGTQVRLVGPRLGVELPALQSGYLVRFEIAAQDDAIDQADIVLNGSALATVQLPGNRAYVTVEARIPRWDGIKRPELLVQARGGEGRAKGAPVNMAVKGFEIGHPRYHAYQLVFERWLTNWGLRLHRTPCRNSPLLDQVDSYDAIWAISEFTRKWISSYWDRSSDILYPPVDVEMFKAGQKRNRILNVGRFFEGSHNKKHRELVTAFKNMVDHGLRDWEFHLAGGSGSRDADREYLKTLYREAEGYPIIIHPDISFDALSKLYSESAIYWHASGLGEDEQLEPIKFEHFGITTVEAMASGCVPVVIARGGQPEIVEHGRNGFLWNTPVELESLTWKLIQTPAQRQAIAQIAARDSRRYDRSHFSSRLEQLLREMKIA